jgi:DNA-binding MarR family transcriptional regulator
MLTTEEQMIVALRGIIRAADIHSHRMQKEFGLTGPQLSILRVIRRLAPVATGTLADAAGFSRATLTGILDRLERQKLIERVRDPGDRRTVVVTPTPEANRLLAKAPSLLHKQLYDELARMPSRERGELLNAVQRVSRLMLADCPELSDKSRTDLGTPEGI